MLSVLPLEKLNVSTPAISRPPYSTLTTSWNVKRPPGVARPSPLASTLLPLALKVNVPSRWNGTSWAARWRAGNEKTPSAAIAMENLRKEMKRFIENLLGSAIVGKRQLWARRPSAAAELKVKGLQ